MRVYRCMKTAYANEREANLHIHRQRLDKKPRVGQKAPYYCEECQCWHLGIIKEGMFTTGGTFKC